MPRGAIGRGRIAKRVTAATYTVEEKIDQVLADASSNAIVIILVNRTSANHVERTVAVQKVDDSDNAITVTSTANATINGQSSFSINGQWNGAVFELDDIGNWHVWTTFNLGQQITDLDISTHSYQTLPIDMNVASTVGSSTDSKYIAPAMFNVIGDALSKTKTYIGALIAKFSITGANPSSYPWAAVVGEIGDGSTGADAAVVAVIGGDSAQTNARAAFAIDNQNTTPGSGFSYVVDGFHASHDGYPAAAPLTAFARLARDSGGTKDVVVKVAAFTDNDVTTLGDGSLVIDPTTGSGKLGVVINGHIQTVTT